MKAILPAYKQVGERRYREISGLYYEDFEPGDTFEHRPGRTILDVDNTWFTLLTMNTQELHFDAAYAAKTEWKKPLVDSTFTLALLTGMPGRHHHCPPRLELRPVEGKRKSLWPSPIFRGRATQERGSVHGQGLKTIRRDRRLGVRSI